MTAQMSLNIKIGQTQRHSYPRTMYIHINAAVVARTHIGQILSFFPILPFTSRVFSD